MSEISMFLEAENNFRKKKDNEIQSLTSRIKELEEALRSIIGRRVSQSCGYCLAKIEKADKALAPVKDEGKGEI